MKNIAKEIVAVDRIARKKIELLETEKKELPEFLRQEKIKKTSEYKKKVEIEIINTVRDNEIELLARKSESAKDLNVRMNDINDKFEKNKESWIGSLFDECVK